MSLALLVLFVLMIGSSLSVRADVIVPSIFGDHIVIQQGKALPLWGWGEPGERITVRIVDKSESAMADALGRWRVQFEPLRPAKDPIEIRITGNNEIVLRDVLIGDVWLCSGQSNMEWPVSRSFDAAATTAAADLPMIRLFVVEKRLSFEPQNNCRGSWKLCSPATVAEFSAVGYHFGRGLHRHFNRPIGLIGSYWGGTRAEGWVSRNGLSKDGSLTDLIETFDHRRDNFVALRTRYVDELVPAWERANSEWTALKTAGDEARAGTAVDAATGAQSAPVQPSPPSPPPHPYLQDPLTPHQAIVLHQGMIAPLGPMALKGVIWYQGESNDHRPMQYRKVFPALINDWRDQFCDAELPFLYVQLAAHRERPASPSHHAWCLIREAQLATLSLPATAMVSAIDVGEVYNIHPLNKRVIGERLISAARCVAYSENVEWSGPMFRTMHVTPEGHVRIGFSHLGGGLMTAQPAPQPSHAAPTPTDQLRGFALAGSDRVFRWADARIEGDEVVVWSELVPQPVAVRYGWASNPDVTLYNREFLPAVPFRTDDWPLADQ